MNVVGKSACEGRGRGRPQLRSDEDTLRVILHAAGTQFRADGYARTSMNVVALKAGVSTKTLYRLVPNKEELFKQVIGERIGRFLLAAEDTGSAGGDVHGELEHLLIAYGSLVLDPETLAIYRLVVSETGRFPELGRAFYEDAYNRAANYIADWLERKCRDGRLKLRNPRMAAGMLRGMIAQDPERSYFLCQSQPPDAADIAERARECTRLFLDGCLVR
jgi:AcrR family transcriptional regulator